MTITAYKAFNRDLQCRGFQYEEGQTYEIEGKPVLCDHGFHFCKALVLTLEYYPVDKCITENKYAEVELLGDVEWEDVIKHKGVTNKIRIKRVIPDEEVLALIDGNSNSGDWNSGDRNSGNSNSGHRNSGDWNSGHWNSGHFNTDTPETIRVFNRECNRELWENTYMPEFLRFSVDEELGYKGSFKKSWVEADKTDRIRIKNLPNFDAGLFEEISSIDVEAES